MLERGAAADPVFFAQVRRLFVDVISTGKTKGYLYPVTTVAKLTGQPADTLAARVDCTELDAACAMLLPLPLPLLAHLPAFFGMDRWFTEPVVRVGAALQLPSQSRSNATLTSCCLGCSVARAADPGACSAASPPRSR